MSTGLGCEPLCKFASRLYFTTFSGPLPKPQTLNTRSATLKPPTVRARGAQGRESSPDAELPYYYFTLDDDLFYLSFFQDWGPLNMAMVYRACILMHELLEDKDLLPYGLVLYASSDPRKKANAALLMALYVMIVHRRTPWDAFQPIAELEFLPFRDAGRGRSDFNLSIQDCLWGIWKAIQCGLCDFSEFNVDDYEYYEKVENGDWNWLTPNFIAFASPVDQNWIKREKEKKANASPSPSRLAFDRKLPQPFVNCLDYFEQRNVKLVVRLNNELYDRQLFLDRAIDHAELYFDDGTNPTDEITRKFIDMADEVIEKGGVVAVHCKAGLGRTGTLIGAYLIWKYGFTASEAIAFMRIVRPGSVVGPQQQFMYLKQLEWAKWAAVDEMKKLQLVPTAVTSTTMVAPATPPAEDEDMSDVATTTTTTNFLTQLLPPVTPSKHVAAATARAKEIAPPGQPRKTPLAKRTASEWDDDEEDDVFPPLPKTPPTRPPPKVAKRVPARSATTSKVRAAPASEQRPSRVTRSTTVAAKKVVPPASSPSKVKIIGGLPNKIPRLAHGTTTRNTSSKPTPLPVHATVTTTTAVTTSKVPITRSPGPGSPVPSRLPTLMKRPQHNTSNSLSNLAATAGSTKKAGPGSDSWVTNNAATVTVPTSKSERPGLRSSTTRRRRSSFSTAEGAA